MVVSCPLLINIFTRFIKVTQTIAEIYSLLCFVH